MIRRVGNWVPCELKPRDVECRFSREKLLQLGPLRLSKTLGNLWIPWPCLIIDGQAEYSWWEDHAVYLVGPARSGNYELLQPNERITGEVYRRQLMRLNMRLIQRNRTNNHECILNPKLKLEKLEKLFDFVDDLEMDENSCLSLSSSCGLRETSFIHRLVLSSIFWEKLYFILENLVID
ncbi:hypothetical protein LAZ67_12003588 [Cordylochernes scorpioides]|uniref:Uncharacterized protein n=1 Tax=Cordylochernes scorpioides TaxID=51811 RepID=A0ABY6L2H6_9ARAC|nr:hypothetical protein LAZ67_12003588 [Cordylochernes scorpioides]